MPECGSGVVFLCRGAVFYFDVF